MKKQWLIIPLFLVLTVTNAQDTTTSTEVVEDITSNDMVIDEAMTNTGVDNTGTNTVATNETMTNEMISPPNIQVDNIGYMLTNDDILFASPLAHFEVQGVDEQSGLKEILVSVDGGSYALYKNPIAFDTEAEHSLNYQFIDRVGNVSYSQTFSVTIDATPPRVVELDITPAPYLAAGNVYVGSNSEISFTTYDDMVGVAFVEYSVNAKEQTRFVSNVTFASMGYTNTEILRLEYEAIDMVSNVSPMKSQLLTLDTTAPVVNVFAKAVDIDGVRYISSKDTIYAEAFDKDTKVVEILYAINGGEFIPYNTEIGIHLMTSGEYNVSVKAKDAVGNVSEEVIYSVVVDMLPPTGDASYIGEARSEEYEDVSFLNKQEETNTEVTSTTETTSVSTDNATIVSEENSIASTTEDSTTIVSPEVPSGTAVDITVPE